MQEIAPIDLPFVNYTMPPLIAHHNDGVALAVVLGLPSEMGTPYDSEETRYHRKFDLPTLDLDLFNMALENEPVPEPTAEEVAAYQFLKYSLGK